MEKVCGAGVAATSPVAAATAVDSSGGRTRVGSGTAVLATPVLDSASSRGSLHFTHSSRSSGFGSPQRVHLMAETLRLPAPGVKVGDGRPRAPGEGGGRQGAGPPATSAILQAMKRVEIARARSSPLTLRLQLLNAPPWHCSEAFVSTVVMKSLRLATVAPTLCFLKAAAAASSFARSWH